MNRRRFLGLIGSVVVVGAAAIGWWLVSPLFIDTVVDEAFSFDLPTSEDMAKMSKDELSDLAAELEAAVPSEADINELTASDRNAVQQRVMTAAASLPSQDMDESPPANAGPAAVLRGAFAGADEFHRGSGIATIFSVPGVGHVLRLENFSVTNGPALSVLLSSAPSPQSSDELAEYIDLGSLKGNIGNQNYEIAPIHDVTEFRSVVIYCVPFHVVFATADLTQP